MWQHLKEIALIGTDKKPVDATMLGDKVNEAVTTLQSPSEEQFLDTLSIAHYYMEAGSLPSVCEEDVIAFDQEEEQEIAPDEVLDVVKDLSYQDKNIQQEVLNVWLNYLYENKLIISSSMILTLLNVSYGLPNATKQKVLAVIGKRGHWILSFKQDYAVTLVNEETDVWSNGTTAERKLYLENLLQQDVQQALVCLKQTWDSESVTVKKSFIGLLQNYTTEEVYAFAAEKYSNEFAWREKEKQTSTECRYLLAKMLLSDTTSELFQSIRDSLKPYFQKEKGKLLSFGGTGKMKLVLPREPDAFFNVDVMNKQYGLGNKYDIALFDYDTMYWFSELLEAIPLQWWIDEFGFKTEAFKKYLLDDDQFTTVQKNKKISVLKNSLFSALSQVKNKDLVELFCSEGFVHDHPQLLSYLSLDKFEKFMYRNKTISEVWFLAYSPAGIWSSFFSEKLMGCVFEFAKKGDYYALQSIFRSSVHHMHVDALHFLERYNASLQESPNYNMWEKHFYSPLKYMLNVKQVLKQDLKKN